MGDKINYIFYTKGRKTEKIICDTIDTLYHRNSITNFMEEAYKYCIKYENEIRKHIEMEENSF